MSVKSDDIYPGKRILVSIFSQPWPQGQKNPPCQKNLQQFDNGEADADYLLLKDTFENFKDENITVGKSLNRLNTQAIQEHISKIKAADFDKFIFIFLTFKGAEDGLIHTHDDQQYQIEKAFEKMTKNVDMRGKPKLILVQADDQSAKIKLFEKGVKRVWKKIPSDVDRLVMTSTIPQLKNGPSLMIRYFCDFITKNRKLSEKDQQDMGFLAIDINNRIKDAIAELDNREMQQMLDVPLIFSSLTKDFMI